MTVRKTPIPDLVHGPWAPLWKSYVRALRAEGRSDLTLETYGYALAAFQQHLAGQGRLPALHQVTRDQVRGFLAHLGETRQPGTVHNRFRALRTFFRWMLAEGEMPQDAYPMANVAEPQLPQTVPEVLPQDAVARMLEVCAGRDFAGRRDAALIRFLLDTGARRGEVAGMTMDRRDLDLDAQLARLVGKGSKERVVRFGQKAARDLDRYLRARASHPKAQTRIPVALGRADETALALWVGKRGAMTGSGVYQVVRDRAREAGLEERVFAHVFRSTFADAWLSADGSETDLMTLAGWESMTMLRRYVRRRQMERARAAHVRLSPGDRV